jgi:hypothetical protein
LADGAGVRYGREIGDLVRAAVAGDQQAVASQRSRVETMLGRAAMVDTLAVFANFSMMTRIADATGTPLDPGSVDISAGLRAGLGLDSLTSTRFQEPGPAVSGR